MENKKRKVRTCRVKCILPTDEVKQIVLLHSVSTKRIEDKISSLSSMVSTICDARDVDIDSLMKSCDSLDRKLDRLTIFCGFSVLLFSVIAFAFFV